MQITFCVVIFYFLIREAIVAEKVHGRQRAARKGGGGNRHSERRNRDREMRLKKIKKEEEIVAGLSGTSGSAAQTVAAQ